MTGKILDRVRKLLALANDDRAPEAERDTALQMAYKTLAKHNLSMVDLDNHTKDAQEPRDTYSNPGWSQMWAKQAAGIIAKLFFCEFFYSGRINATKCNHHFVGRESNATTAMLMSNYVINSILKEARSRYKHNLSPESRNFALGAVARLSRRVEEMMREEQQEAAPGNALVLVSLYKTEQSANEALLPADLKYKEVKSKVSDRNAYHAGAEFAQTINLNLQVSADGKAEAKQLTKE